MGPKTPGFPQFDFQTPDLVADLRVEPRIPRVKGLLDRYERGDLGEQCLGFRIIAHGIGTLMRRKTKAAEPSLLTGLLVDARKRQASWIMPRGPSAHGLDPWGTRTLPAPCFSPGAGLASPCSRRRAPLSSGEPVKPAVGAGDSMLAGIVLGLSRGLPLRDAVRFGMAAGAAALLGSGTQLCRRSDVERLYAGPEYLLDA